jgi:hypothetical protein
MVLDGAEGNRKPRNIILRPVSLRTQGYPVFWQEKPRKSEYSSMFNGAGRPLDSGKHGFESHIFT